MTIRCYNAQTDNGYDSTDDMYSGVIQAGTVQIFQAVTTQHLSEWHKNIWDMDSKSQDLADHG